MFRHPGKDPHNRSCPGRNYYQRRPSSSGGRGGREPCEDGSQGRISGSQPCPQFIGGSRMEVTRVRVGTGHPLLSQYAHGKMSMLMSCPEEGGLSPPSYGGQRAVWCRSTMAVDPTPHPAPQPRHTCPTSVSHVCLLLLASPSEGSFSESFLTLK